MPYHDQHLQHRKGLHTKVRRPFCLLFNYVDYYTQNIHRLQAFFASWKVREYSSIFPSGRY